MYRLQVLMYIILSVLVQKYLLYFSYFLRKLLVQLICLFCTLILPNYQLFICVLNLTFYVLVSLAQLVRTMHNIYKIRGSNPGHNREKKNTSSNLKRGLYFEKKFNRYITCLDIETEIVYRVSCAIILCFKMFLFQLIFIFGFLKKQFVVGTGCGVGKP